VLPRDGWEVMGEMNPQVLKQLRVVAQSQPMVSVVTCFRGGSSGTLKERAIKAAEGSIGKPAFNQIMALFKSDGLVHQPVSCLESARQLLAKYHQVCSATNDGKAPASGAGQAAEDSREGAMKTQTMKTKTMGSRVMGITLRTVLFFLACLDRDAAHLCRGHHSPARTHVPGKTSNPKLTAWPFHA